MSGRRLARACLIWVACLGAASLGCTLVEGARDAVARSLGEPVATSAPVGSGTAEPESVAQLKAGPEVSSQERLWLAYPRDAAVPSLREDRAIGEQVVAWPEMRYLGQAAEFAERGYETVSVMPTEIRVVPGTSVPMAYSPELDEARPVPDGAPRSYSGYDKPLLFIPPNGSLVMVRIETDPAVGVWSGPGSYVCPEDGIRWAYDPYFFMLSYPGLGDTQVELSGDDFWFGDYQSPRGDCPGNGWLYFILPGVDLDPSRLWLEYVGRQLGIWTLAARP